MKTCICCGDGTAPGRGRDFCNGCWSYIDRFNACPGCGVVLEREVDDLGHVEIRHPLRQNINWREPLCIVDGGAPDA